MTGDGPENLPPNGRRFRLLERVTAGVLLLVVALLGWILLAAYQPEEARWAAEEVQVLVALGMLSAALVLVSVVALLHTR